MPKKGKQFVHPDNLKNGQPFKGDTEYKTKFKNIPLKKPDNKLKNAVLDVHKHSNLGLGGQRYNYRRARSTHSNYDKPGNWFKPKNKVKKNLFKGQTDYQKEFTPKSNKFGQWSKMNYDNLKIHKNKFPNKTEYKEGFRNRSRTPDKKMYNLIKDKNNNSGVSQGKMREITHYQKEYYQKKVDNFCPIDKMPKVAKEKYRHAHHLVYNNAKKNWD